MKTDLNTSVKIIDSFSEYGYKAGIICKSNWRDKTEIYDFLKNEIAPNKIIIAPNQIHGAEIIEVNEAGIIYCDGVVSSNSELCLTVSTADCIPLIFVNRDSRLFGAIHIGWRGFISGIVDNLIAYFHDHGKYDQNFIISLGPAIESCCFEVGNEVALLFDEKYLKTKSGKCFIDLKSAVVDKLSSTANGLNISAIENSCTYCNSERYYSYRREGKAPLQMVSFIFNK